MIIQYHIKMKLNKISLTPSLLCDISFYFHPILKSYFFNSEGLDTLEENVKTTSMNVRNLQASAETTPLVQIPLVPSDAPVTLAT